MPDIGDVLSNKYELVRIIGEGGMGSVYEAKHQLIGKQLAIKFLHKRLIDKPVAAARFTREAQAAAAIGHLSIIDIHDVGQTEDGSLYLVMEFLKGQNLGTLIAKEKHLAPELVAYVTAQTLSALAAAHQAGIVHRDLKPDNIFLKETGQNLPGIKLLDFGISKMLSISSMEDRLTKTGAMMGTPFYMSPEQAGGDKDADHRADIYSMGVIMYEACTGKVPFYADNILALAHKILSDTLVPPRELRPDLPVALEKIILKALSRDPDDRYPDAIEMLDDVLPLTDRAARERVPLPEELVVERDTVPDEPLAQEETPDPDATPTLVGLDTTDDPHAKNEPIVVAAQTNMAWSPDTTPPPKRFMKGLVLGLISIVLVLGGVLAYVLIQTSSPISPPRSISTTTPSNPETPPIKFLDADAPTEAPRQHPPQEPLPGAHLVHITLEGLPQEARVLLNNSPMDGPTLSAPRSSIPHELSVQLTGHRTWSKRVIFQEDQTFTVELSPLREPHKTPRTPQPSKRTEPSFISEFGDTDE